MFSATGETCDRASDAADTREFLFAIRAAINKTGDVSFCCERQIVTTRFIGDAEIATSFAPFCAVRSDPLSPGPKLGEQVRQLVSKCAIDFGETVIVKQRIQRN